MDIKYLRAVFTGGSYCKTRPLTRQDYGITLQFVHPDLPETYQVHFSNSKENTGTAKTQIATANGVTIPDEYLIPGKSVYAWAFLQADGAGRTRCMVEIPVASKPTVTDAPPTPQQRSAIDEAIEALNDGVERAEDAAGKAEEATEHYPRIVDSYWQVWDAEAQEWYNTGVKAVGEDGLPGRDGADGQDGAPGVTYTPTVSADGEISWTNDGGLPNPQPRNIIGPTGADGAPGQPGRDGAPGPAGKSAYESAQDGGYSGTEAQFETDLADVSGKQPTLVSGENIKTINGNSILGSGDLPIQGGGGVTEVNGQTGEVELDAEDVGALPDSSTLDDIPDGSTYKRLTSAQLQQIQTNAANIQTQSGEIDQLQTDVDAIEQKIPNQASSSNQLADKAFVNSSINSAAAFFRGAFPTRAALFAVAWQTTDPSAENYVSNNDYAYVADDETHNDEAWRYIYVLQPGGTGNGWQPQFRVNESPLTAAQIAALNSGATAALIEQISTNAAAIALKQKRINASGILKGSGNGQVSAAVAGTDYQPPLTAGTDYATPAQVNAKYTKPAGGIPASDMTQAVQTSLGKADTALQAVPNTYRTAAAQDEIDATKLPSTTKYAASQNVGGAADKALSIPMGAVDSTSTATAFTATIDGITALRSGVLVWLTNGVVTSAADCTLNINNLGAKPIYNSNAATTATTTTFNVNYTMLFIYNAMRVEGGCWDMVYGYDANTTYTPVKLGFGYATCSTAAATAAKTASLSSYTLTANSLVAVRFENDVTAGATLNINGKGAKPIYYEGAAIQTGVIKGGDTALFVYSTYYRLLSIDRWGDDISDLMGQISEKLAAPATAGTAGQILEQGSSGPVWADRDRVVTVTGTTPTITAQPGVRYVCGEVTTLDITLPASGVVDVTFESGSTATVLTITPPTGQTVRWANGFDPTALDANTSYEINVMDGLGVAAQWT